MKHTQALPGLLKSLTGQIDHEAELLGDRVRKLSEKAAPVFKRGHAQLAARENAITEAEQFVKELEAVLGDNGGPTLTSVPDKVICARCNADAAFRVLDNGMLEVTHHGETRQQELGTASVQTAFA